MVLPDAFTTKTSNNISSYTTLICPDGADTFIGSADLVVLYPSNNPNITFILFLDTKRFNNY